MFTHPPHRVKERSKCKAQKKAKAFLYDHPQQPTDVVTGCAQQGVNPIASFTLQVTPIHSVIMLQMPDHGLNRLAALQQPQFGFVQSPLLAAMIDLNTWIIVIDVTMGRVAWTLAGPRAATVLGSGCPLDFDARVFAPGTCAQSLYGHVNALYCRHANGDFTMFVARSFARDMWATLCGASAQHGYDVRPSAPFR